MKQIKNIFAKYIPAIVFFGSILLIWELLIRTGLISFYLLPKPSEIISALINNWDVIFPHVIQTLIETIVGLILAIFFGYSTAILLDMSPRVKKVIYPLIITSQTIPMIALAPLLLLWFGFGLTPKVIIVVLSCFFPITIATIGGFAQIDRDFTKLLQSMDASNWQTLWFIKLPGSLPQFFSGLKIAATYSVTGAIVGEYVGGYQGLGIYMQEVAHSHVISLVFAAITITILLSLLLFFLVMLIENITIPWNRVK